MTQAYYYQPPSVGEDIYSGAARLGKLIALIWAIIATILALIAIGFGIRDFHQGNSARGWTLVIIGLVIIIFSWLWVYLTQRYKFLAAFEGVTLFNRYSD